MPRSVSKTASSDGPSRHFKSHGALLFGLLASLRPAALVTGMAQRGDLGQEAEVRSVDPHVNGSPVITYEAIRPIEKAYFQGTIYLRLELVGLERVAAAAGSAGYAATRAKA